MAGTKNTSIRSYNFFRDSVVAAPGTYAANGPYEFVDPDGTPFLSQTIQVINDTAAFLFFSFDGVNDHGKLLSNEPLTQDFRRVRKIWIRGTAGSAYRLWAW
jgi:hypothetical protein